MEKVEVLLITDDSYSKRTIMNTFFGELQKAVEDQRLPYFIKMTPANEVFEEIISADIVLIEPSLILLKKKIDKLFSSLMKIDILDMFAYGTQNSALVLEQIIEMDNNISSYFHRRRQLKPEKEVVYSPIPDWVVANV